MEKKILCVVRVSTTKQETESQHNSMLEWLTGMGYSDNEIEWLESAGASARSLNDKYLNLLEDIKRITTTTTIKTVALWHINRLGRVESKLMMMKEFFVKNKVQLLIKQSNVTLLDDNGNLTTSGSLVFSMFSAMVAEETAEMMDKCERGKAERRNNGLWEGAMLPLGYTLEDVGDKKKRVIVDEGEGKSAETVRKIFELYSTGQWSTTRLVDELSMQGIKDADGHSFTQSRIATILSKKCYTGEIGTRRVKNKTTGKYEVVSEKRQYPAIITTELFNKCEALRKNGKVARTHNYASAYLCNKLIKCSCGYNYTASTTTYRCFKEHDEDINKVPQSKRLQHTHVALSIDMMDSLIWRLAADMEVGKLLEKDRLKVKDYIAELETAEIKLRTVEDKLSKFETKRERLIDLASDGLLTKDKAKVKMEKINADEATAKAEREAVKADVKRLTNIIKTLQHPTIDINLFERLNENLPENIEKKRAIVRTHIEKITVSAWQTVTTAELDATNIFKSKTKEKRYTLITVYDVYGYKYEYRYFPRWSFGQSRLEQLTEGVWSCPTKKEDEEKKVAQYI